MYISHILAHCILNLNSLKIKWQSLTQVNALASNRLLSLRELVIEGSASDAQSVAALMNILTLSPELHILMHSPYDQAQYDLQHLPISALPNLNSLRSSPALIRKLAPARAVHYIETVTFADPTTRFWESFVEYPMAHLRQLTINLQCNLC